VAGHTDLLLGLLPPVSYAPQAPGIRASCAADGLALDRAHADAEKALGPLTPFRALAWLEDYERVYGLPGPCTRPGLTLGERISALAIALQERGGISRAYFQRLAKVLGYEVGVREHKPFRAGSRAGEPLTNGDWRYAWTVQAPAQTTHHFRAGRSRAGEQLSRWGDELLECLIRSRKPSHTIVHFAYGE